MSNASITLDIINRKSCNISEIVIIKNRMVKIIFVTPEMASFVYIQRPENVRINLNISRVIKPVYISKKSALILHQLKISYAKSWGYCFFFFLKLTNFVYGSGGLNFKMTLQGA